MRSHSRRVVTLFVAGLGLAATSSVGAGERLSMRVNPQMAFAPATLVVDTIAERDSANRAIEVVVESSEYYRSSTRQLDGEAAARTMRIQYDSVPGGTYEVKVILFGEDGKPRAETSRRVQVVSSLDR